MNFIFDHMILLHSIFAILEIRIGNLKLRRISEHGFRDFSSKSLWHKPDRLFSGMDSVEDFRDGQPGVCSSIATSFGERPELPRGNALLRRHHHHLFWKHLFLPRYARVRRSTIWSPSTHPWILLTFMSLSTHSFQVFLFLLLHLAPATSTFLHSACSESWRGRRWWARWLGLCHLSDKTVLKSSKKVQKML